MDALRDTAQKSALDLALELGVRSETVVRALQQLGVPDAGISDPVDPDLENVLIEQLVNNGSIPEKMRSGKGRRKRGEEPVVDDDMLFKALGASEKGFSESNIPHQIRLESSFQEKPASLFNWFSKKKRDISRALKESSTSGEDLNAMFAAPAQRQQRESMTSEDVGERDLFGEETAPVQEMAVSGETDMDIDDLEGLDDLDMDIDVDDLELGELEELAPITAGEQKKNAEDDADAEDDEIDLDLDDLDGLELDDEDLAGEGDQATGDEQQESEGEGEADTEGGKTEETGGEDEEEEHQPGFIERILSRIQLTPTEMWTFTGGLLAGMVLLLAATIYWWSNYSPAAEVELFDSALGHFDKAQDRIEITPETVVDEYALAAKEFLEYANNFSGDSRYPIAYRNLCDSYFYMAKELKDLNRKDEANSAFSNAINYYKQYLDYLENRADQALSQINQTGQSVLAEAFPEVEQQQQVIINIAESQAELMRYDEAISTYTDFVNRFNDAPRAIEARFKIGELYQNLAVQDKEGAPQHLQSAITTYEDALRIYENRMTPSDRMDNYFQLGEIKHTLYDRTLAEERAEEANTHLMDAIAYFERAEEEARKVEMLPISQKVEKFKTLADHYLLWGKISGEKWRERQELAALYPQGDNYKQTLEQGAEKEKQITEEYLNKAMALYEELLEDQEILEAGDEYEILYNLTDSLRVLQRYPEALGVGEELADELTERKSAEVDEHKLIRTKIYYLLGHIAWDMAQGSNYSNVKKYYSMALDEDDFFPKEENGETSHLALIRLTNVYFMLEGKYEEAIQRYKKAVDLFPEDGYSYLTFYWYGKALEEYGDKLMAEAGEKKQEIDRFGPNSQLQAEINTLRERAKSLFSDAIDQYGRAVQVREKSKYIDTRTQEFLVDLSFHRGFCAFKRGDYVPEDNVFNAKQFLTDALREYQDHPVAKKEDYIQTAIERMGDLFVIKGDTGSGIDWYLKYLDESYPDPNAKIRMKLADAYLQQFSYDKARDTYRKIIDDYPPRTQRDIERDMRDGRPVDMGPRYEAYKKIAQSYLKEAVASPDGEEKRREALAVYQEFARKYPQKNNPLVPWDPEVQKTIGDIYYDLEEYPNSATNYEAFLNNNPDYPRKGMIYWRIGKSYLRSDSVDKAIGTLNMVDESMLDTKDQFAASLMDLAEAYQLKAEQMNQAGDDAQYEKYLRDAVKTYNNVTQTQVPNLTAQANRNSLAIQRILDNRDQLAAETAAKGN